MQMAAIQQKQITKNSKTLITFFVVSPNEKYIAYNDKNEMLRVADVATGEVKFNYDSSYGGVYEVGWSPDSRFLNITRSIENSNAQICLLDMQTMKMTPVTTTRLNSYSPSWSADSSWLYFVSERNFHTKIGSPWGSRQPEPFYTETQNIYAFPLDSASKFPFLQKDSWLTDSVFNPVVSTAKKKWR
jgi:tricorn protease